MFCKSERGNSLVIFAICLPVFIGFAAISLDGGLMLLSRIELQNAVDAAALAGSTALLLDQQAARNRAILVGSANRVLSTLVTIQPANVTFPSPTQIRVDGTHTLPLYFARLMGINTTVVRATSTAQLGNVVATEGLKPWVVPGLQPQYGRQVVLKAGDLDEPGTNPSFYFAVCYPPLNRGTPVRGANAYEQNIVSGAQMTVFVGDELLIEPGNMVGPTRHGVDQLMASDPGAYWDGITVVGSAFPGYSSPRIVRVPFFDPTTPPGPGRDSVTINALGALFLEGMQGKDVVGRFIKIITKGEYGNVSMGLYNVRLIN